MSNQAGYGIITKGDGGGAATPGGADTNVQFNDAGSFGGSDDFVWNDTSKNFQVGQLSTNGNRIYLDGGSGTFGVQCVSAQIGDVDLDGNKTNISVDDTGKNLINQVDGNFYIWDSLNAVNIKVDTVAQLITLANVPSHADDAAATGAGLTTGQLYKTTDSGSTFLKIVP